MTCIVGLADNGKVWLGGDRAAVEANHYLNPTAQPKVFRRGTFVMGYTSSFRMGQLLQYRLAVPEIPADCDMDEFMATAFADAVRTCLKDGGYTKIDCNRETVGQFLVGSKGMLYVFDDDHNVRRPHGGFDAVGSGTSVALGAMHATMKADMTPTDRLTLALEAACSYVTTVCPPFDIISD